MAVYLVTKNKKHNNKDNDSMMAMVNIIPAIIWAIVFCQKFCDSLTFWPKLGIGIVFVIVYMVLSILPYISLVMNVASAIMYIGMVWALVDLIGNETVKLVGKIVTAIIIGLIELSLFVIPTFGAMTKNMKKSRYSKK